MKLRSLISAALCAAAVVFTAPFVYVSADNGASQTENTETAAMRNAILDVKKRVNIPSDFDEFEYDTTTKYDTTYYEFRWDRIEFDKKNNYSYSAEAVIVEYFNGFISRYIYLGEDEDSKPSFSKLTAKEQDDLAKKYLYQLNPDLKGNPIIERTSSRMDLFEKTVRYKISRENSGINLGKNYGAIAIDRDTGKLVSCSLTWWNDAEFPDASKRLSVSEVSDIYASRKPLKAYYDLFTKYEYDKEKDKYIYTPYVLAVYAPTVSGEYEIDAITGKRTSIYEDKKKFSYTDAYTWDSDDSADYESEEESCAEDNEYTEYLSDAEKEVLEKENEYISYEEALKIIKADEYIVFNKELVLESNYISYYTNDYGKICPFRRMNFEFTSSDKTKDSIYLYVALDAYTGEIISFNKTYDYGAESKNKNETAINEENALAIAEKASEHFIGDKAGEYRYDKNVNVEEHTVIGAFDYTRYVNGLPAVFDTMTVWVDSRGEVLNFAYKYHEIEFPEANLVSEKTAYKKLFENMKPVLRYTGFTDLQLVSHVYLTYTFDPFYYINAITGERISSDGEPYYTAEKETAPQKEAKLYTDIKGHKYEKEISTLFDYGVRIADSDILDPNGAITVGEFAKLCRSACGTDILVLYPYEKKV